MFSRTRAICFYFASELGSLWLFAVNVFFKMQQQGCSVVMGVSFVLKHFSSHIVSSPWKSERGNAPNCLPWMFPEDKDGHNVRSAWLLGTTLSKVPTVIVSRSSFIPAAISKFYDWETVMGSLCQSACFPQLLTLTTTPCHPQNQIPPPPPAWLCPACPCLFPMAFPANLWILFRGLRLTLCPRSLNARIHGFGLAFECMWCWWRYQDCRARKWSSLTVLDRWWQEKRNSVSTIKDAGMD